MNICVTQQIFVSVFQVCIPAVRKKYLLKKVFCRVKFIRCTYLANYFGNKVYLAQLGTWKILTYFHKCFLVPIGYRKNNNHLENSHFNFVQCTDENVKSYALKKSVPLNKVILANKIISLTISLQGYDMFCYS